jgi:hypothetical protein
VLEEARQQRSVVEKFVLTLQESCSLTEMIIIFETSRLAQLTQSHRLRNVDLSYWQPPQAYYKQIEYVKYVYITRPRSRGSIPVRGKKFSPYP